MLPVILIIISAGCIHIIYNKNIKKESSGSTFWDLFISNGI